MDIEQPTVDPLTHKMENVLKRKKSLDILEKQRANAKLIKNQQKERRKEAMRSEKPFRFKKPESIVMDYRKQERNKVRAKKIENNHSRLNKDLKTLKTHSQQLGTPEDQDHLALIIRIRGRNGLTPKIRSVLNDLKLTTKGAAVLHPVNEKQIKLLKIAEPYVTWGFPNKQTIRDLLYKRGYARVGDTREKKALTDNAFIEEQLGESTGIICMEDIVHELFARGDNFEAVTNFLWPFQLETPAGGFPNTRQPFQQGGDCGNRAEKIVDLVTRMI